MAQCRVNRLTSHFLEVGSSLVTNSMAFENMECNNIFWSIHCVRAVGISFICMIRSL